MTTLVMLLAALVALLAGLMGLSKGYELGYRRGHAASESEHDFDRCKNCGEAPWFEESEE